VSGKSASLSSVRKILGLPALFVLLGGLFGCESDPQKPEPARTDVIRDFLAYCFSDSIDIESIWSPVSESKATFFALVGTNS